MSDGWIAVLVIVLVVVYLFGKILGYMRRSEEQWREVDKNKLNKWKGDR